MRACKWGSLEWVGGEFANICGCSGAGAARSVGSGAGVVCVEGVAEEDLAGAEDCEYTVEADVGGEERDLRLVI